VEVDRKKGIGDNEKQETREVLYVRYGNRTIQKEGPDIHEHLRQHFGDFMSTDL
jgi:hypothetical protein